MVEQYIYSRSKREFTNANNQTIPLGFGFVAFSPGMSSALKDAVKVHCQDCPRLTQTDSEGVPLPLLRKVRLPKGQLVLQKGTWIEEEIRDFQVAHGYVLEHKEVVEAGPAGWLTAPFRLGNPNAVEGGILLHSLSELPDGETLSFGSLKETITALGLGKKKFCQLLLACFDALSSRGQVLIAWDFERPKEQELRLSILYWIYTLLPYDLWSALGFDSVFTGESSLGQVHLAFVDRVSVQTEGQTPSIQVGNNLLALGRNFLILDGAIIHSDGKHKTEWYGENGIYARWLEQVANTLWDCPADELDSMVQALAQFHQSFQQMQNGKKLRLDPQWYNAICEKTLSHAPHALAEACERVRSSITDSESYDCGLMLIDQLEEKERRKLLMDLFQKQRKRGTPVDETDVKMLCALFESGLEAPVAGFLSAVMAEEADAPGARVTAVVSRYQEILPPEIYSMLPEHLFFDRLSKEDMPFWAECGVENGGKAVERRRNTWFRETLPAEKNMWDMPASIQQALRELHGLDDQQKAELWQQPFQNWCRSVLETDLEPYVDEKLPQQFRTFEQELSSMPGGAPHEAVDVLRQKIYSLLLSDARPFMDKQWLSTALSGQKIGGEIGQTLEILNKFTNEVRGGSRDITVWQDSHKGRSEGARRRAFALLPKMFLNETLPRIWCGFVVSFLHQRPKKCPELLRRAARQRGEDPHKGGGGDLLLAMLDYARKFPRELERGGQTDLLTITQIVCQDQKIMDLLKENDSGYAQFYSELMTFLQDAKTKKALDNNEISSAISSLRSNAAVGSGGWLDEQPKLEKIAKPGKDTKRNKKKTGRK